MTRSRSTLLFEAFSVAGLLVVPSFIRALYGYLYPDSLAAGGEHSQLVFVEELLGQAFLLLVVWQIVRLNGESWRDFTEPPEKVDLFRSVGLAIAGYVACWAFSSALYTLVPRFSEMSDRPASLDQFRAPLTVGYVAMMVVNPHFEELIVRGYLQTRLRQAGFAGVSIVLTSTLLQAAYHIYQGLPAAIGLWGTFLFWGAYYHRTRRIWPVVGAHLIMDLAGALFYSRGAA